jgi:hypothetical protein
MVETVRFDLAPDRVGVIWDLLLYVPTVLVLASLAVRFWYGGDQGLAYLLYFLTCFFLIVGFNRIFKTRLLLLPSAPICMEVGEHVGLLQRNGGRVDLVKKIRFYADYSGRTFGISGLDGVGKQLQFVFHKGQFAGADQYKLVQEALKHAASATGA